MTNKLTIIAFVTMLTNYAAFSQNCNLVIKDGSKITLTAYSWTNPHLYDPKFQKLKDDKKDEEIEVYNESVMSAKLQPASTYPMIFSVKRTTLTSGAEELILTTNIGGKDYSSYALCKNDTLYSYRNKGIVELPDGKGGSLGFTIQEPAKYPLNLKIGDKLNPYYDNSFLNPITSEIRTKIAVVEGDYLVTYSVKALETLSFSSQVIHYMFAEVKGEEEITISGLKYKAFIIESQTWNKGKMDVNITTAYSDVNEWNRKGIEKSQANFEKMMKRKQYTNEQGYTVSYTREWFIPTIGVVKTESYDNLGGIAGKMTVTGIQ